MARRTNNAAETIATRGEVPLTWVNSPQQDRSMRTLERILDATEHVIRTKGVGAVTIPGVARAAKSSVGSFYARFPDKTSLLRTLHERACEQSLATAAAALDPARWRGVPTREILATFVAFMVKLFAERSPMMLAFSSALGQDAVFAERRAAYGRKIDLLLRELLLARKGEIGHAEPTVAIDMCLRIVTATLEQRNALEMATKTDVRVGDETMTAELTRVVVAYLALQP